MTRWIVALLQTRIGRYATSIVALVVAAILTLVIVRFHLPRQITSYAFLFVIIGSAWWGGYGPGLITTFATLLLGPYLTQPAYSIAHARLNTLPDDPPDLGVNQSHGGLAREDPRSQCVTR